MSITQNSDKSILVISRTIYEALDPFHRALAEVLSEHGEVVIEGMVNAT